jgi:hypothetical protein
LEVEEFLGGARICTSYWLDSSSRPAIPSSTLVHEFRGDSRSDLLLLFQQGVSLMEGAFLGMGIMDFCMI